MTPANARVNTLQSEHLHALAARPSWGQTFKDAVRYGITPLWVAGICGMLTVAVMASALHHPASSQPLTTTNSTQNQPVSPSNAAGPTGTDGMASQPAPTTSNTEEQSMAQQSQSNNFHSSVQSDANGTTITVNGHTETVPPGQSVNRTFSMQQGGSTTQVTISAQSSQSSDGSSSSQSSHMSVNTQAQSTNGGTEAP